MAMMIEKRNHSELETLCAIEQIKTAVGAGKIRLVASM